MNFKKFGKLPGKPSELLTLALKNMRKAHRLNWVRTNQMNHDWVRFSKNGTCSVCLAGAVMMGLQHWQKIVPVINLGLGCNNNEYLAYRALNNFRLGFTVDAFLCLGLSRLDGTKYKRKIRSQHRNGPNFIADITKLRDDLRKDGY